MIIDIEGDANILKQFNSCLSCLLKGFRCQDVLIRITCEYLMLYSLPTGGFSSCFQFNFDKRLFDKFEINQIEVFERVYRVSSLLNCFSNTQWLKATRFIIEIYDKDDTLRIKLSGRNGITRRHCLYPIISISDRIFLHEKITWKRRHGIRISSGLLKDIFNYMEMKESLMTLSLNSIDSEMSIKVNPIGNSIIENTSNINNVTNNNVSNNSTYQDIQIKKEQIETFYLCQDIIDNNSFTFNSREFKVAIALAESCQLPIFITLRSPGSPLIVSMGQRAIIDHICINECYSKNTVPFEYHWINPLFQSQLYQQDSEYIDKTQTIGFSAVFLISTTVQYENNQGFILDFHSPSDDINETFCDQDLSIVESNIEINADQLSSRTLETNSNDNNNSDIINSDCSFISLDKFDLSTLFEKFCVEISSSKELEIPPSDQGIVSHDWISTLLW